MSKSAKLLIAIIIVAAIAVGVILFTNKSDTKSSSDKTPSTSTNNSGSASTDTTQSDKKIAATITYDGTTFSPEKTTVKAGETVKVINTSSNASLGFDSDPHPVHTDNPDLNAGEIGPGQSATFSTDKTGTWGFHNHDDPTQHGELVVQ